MSERHRPAIAGGTPVRAISLPYGRHHMDGADVEAVGAALRSGVLTGGETIERFEAALAAHCGVGHAVACSNGTAALHLALAAVGVGPGDNVIVPPLTFAATANAVLYCGADPRFADIGPDRCLDPGATSSRVDERTRAVVTVDYSGLPADVPVLRPVLPRGMPVVVDGAHSLGAELAGRPAGSLGDVTTLSFHPVKMITSGEGGACVTNDAELAATMRRLRNHGLTTTAAERRGRIWKYDLVTLGHNYRLTDFQAALGASQLGRLGAALVARQHLAARYDTLLRGIEGLTLPPRPPERRSAWHLYAIEVDAADFGTTRDDLIDALRADNIEATLHYPSVHLLALYRARGHSEGEAPVAESTCDRLVTLPLFPDMTERDQDDVIEALRRIQLWARETAVAGV